MFSFLRKLFPVREPQVVEASAQVIGEMYATINFTRGLKRLKPLNRSADADAIAQQWADHLAKGNGAIGHGDFSNRVSGKFPNKVAFEVIETNHYFLEESHTDSVVDEWMNDPPHRALLLKDADVIGIGCASSDGHNYWVVDFIKNNS